MSKRIALLIHSLAGGGAENLMSRLADRWSRANEVHLITWSGLTADDYPIPANVVRHALNLQQSSQGLLSGIIANVRRTKRLRQTLRKISPQVGLSFCDQMNIVAIEAAKPLSFPLWIAEHNDPRQQVLSRLWEAWRRRNYPLCEGCVVLTESIKQHMCRWLEPEHLHVIPPAICPNNAQKTRQSLGEAKFLFAGRLSHQKAVHRLLLAWHEVHSKLPDSSLVIVGDGPLRTELEALAERLALRNLRFAGWQREPTEYFLAADIFVLPSRYEGFPVALLEALDNRLPGIVTDCTSAIPELQQAGPCLEVVNAETEHDITRGLVAAMLKLGQNAEYRESLAAQATRVAASYHWSKVGPLWDQLILAD